MEKQKSYSDYIRNTAVNNTWYNRAVFISYNIIIIILSCKSFLGDEMGDVVICNKSTSVLDLVQLLKGMDGRDGKEGRDGRDGEKGEPGPAGAQGPVGA